MRVVVGKARGFSLPKNKVNRKRKKPSMDAVPETFEKIECRKSPEEFFHFLLSELLFLIVKTKLEGGYQS